MGLVLHIIDDFNSGLHLKYLRLWTRLDLSVSESCRSEPTKFTILIHVVRPDDLFHRQNFCCWYREVYCKFHIVCIGIIQTLLRTVQIGSLMMTYCKSEVRLDDNILSLPDKSSAADLVRSINSNVMFIRNLVIFKLQKNFRRSRK